MSIHDYIEKRRALAEAAELAGIFFAALSELRGNDHVDEEAITHIAASGPETTLAELRVVEAAAEHRAARKEYLFHRRGTYDNGEPMAIPQRVTDRWADSCGDLEDALAALTDTEGDQ